jgi:hypothetical protein
MARLMILLALLLPLAACEEKVTAENYAQLKPGMTLAQAETVMGGPGEREEATGMSISGAGIASASSSNSQRTYVWKTKGAQISVTVDKNDKVVSTGSSGL